MNPNYSDIIGRERPVHKNDGFDIRHPKMRRQLRAKQFAPFDALAGFPENTPVRVSVTFFKRDRRQEAIHADGIRGDTVRLDGDVTAFDAVSQALRVSGGLIPFSDIYEIDAEL